MDVDLYCWLWSLYGIERQSNLLDCMVEQHTDLLGIICSMNMLQSLVISRPSLLA